MSFIVLEEWKLCEDCKVFNFPMCSECEWTDPAVAEAAAKAKATLGVAASPTADQQQLQMNYSLLYHLF